MNFFQTLIRPDKEENPERAEVGRAANLLQVGEFQFLQLAYYEWHGHDLPEALIDQLFSAYMVHDRVPPWARSYARHILDLASRGSLDDKDPFYHRYDVDPSSPISPGVRNFLIAASIVVAFLGGGVLVSHFASGDGLSVLPPYFEKEELKSGAAADRTKLHP